MISTVTPSSSALVRDAGDDQHTTGRVDVGREHVDVGGLLHADECGVRHGDRRRVPVGPSRHVDAHEAGGRLHAVGDRVLEVVGAHGRADEAERAAVVVGRDRGLGLRRNRRQPEVTGPSPHVPQRIDLDLLTLGRECDERFGDEWHVARPVDGAP